MTSMSMTLLTFVASGRRVGENRTIPDGGLRKGDYLHPPVKLDLVFKGTVTLCIDEGFDFLPYTCDLNCKQSGIIAAQSDHYPLPPLWRHFCSTRP
jgi:hypothetical protein